MKRLLILVFAFSIQVQAQSFRDAFRKSTLAEISYYHPIDTVLTTPGYRIMVAHVPFNSMSKRLVVEKRGRRKSTLYMIMDESAHLAPDSTIIILGVPIKSPPATQWKEGVWFYMAPYQDKWGGGARTVVDTLPGPVNPFTRIKAPGVYQYVNGSVRKVQKDQSDRYFLYHANRPGFFFVPDPGRYYIRFPVTDLFKGKAHPSPPIQ